jgi:hypothetical protein
MFVSLAGCLPEKIMSALFDVLDVTTAEGARPPLIMATLCTAVATDLMLAGYEDDLYRTVLANDAQILVNRSSLRHCQYSLHWVVQYQEPVDLMGGGHFVWYTARGIL